MRDAYGSARADPRLDVERADDRRSSLDFDGTDVRDSRFIQSQGLETGVAPRVSFATYEQVCVDIKDLHTV